MHFHFYLSVSLDTWTDARVKRLLSLHTHAHAIRWPADTMSDENEFSASQNSTENENIAKLAPHIIHIGLHEHT